jgi:hypothetical protein
MCERYEKSGGNRCFENPDDKWVGEDATGSACNPCGDTLQGERYTSSFPFMR